MATMFPGKPVLATPDEQPALDKLESAMLESKKDRAPKLVGPDGESIALPQSLVRLLRQLVSDLAQGRAVMLVSRDRELTTQQAADLLNVSRPFLVKLLEGGEIPFAKTGSHRRILLADLMAYKQRRDANRREGLARLTRMGEEMGDYD